VQVAWIGVEMVPQDVVWQHFVALLGFMNVGFWRDAIVCVGISERVRSYDSCYVSERAVSIWGY
jgi:hypothetical protein